MDIYSQNKYPANALSNFAPHAFVLDDVPIASMEGFLQSLKFKNLNSQLNTCSMVGIRAKRKGSKKDWWHDQTLYWRGIAYPRKSEAYQQLINRAYIALTSQNRKFQRALLASGEAVFTHHEGRHKASQTVLTSQEFVHELTHMRYLLKVNQIKQLK